jgi:hypothetical protein
VGDQARFDRLKADAAARAARLHPRANRPTRAANPVAGPSWKGVDENDLAPPDTTGAMGPQRYIEAINLQLAIYTRAAALLSNRTMAQMTGSSDFLSDPQIEFDTASQRFAYEILDATDDTLFVGFSKTNNPSNLTTDFCTYKFDFGWGALLPDYPKLGNTTDFWLIGVNLYAGQAFVGSDVAWMTKPGPGALQSCPAQTSFKTGKQTMLMSDDMTLSSTPEPAKQADQSATGWIVAVPDPTNSGASGTKLELYKVTKNQDGTANIQKVGTPVAVPFYSPPSPAPQMGGAHPIDTLDGRLINAMSGVDPAHGNSTAVWTSHAVFGGGGSQVNWYEINVAGAALFQNGVVSDPNLYAFNGAISSDRAAGGTVHAFGSDMVVGFTTSSTSAFPAIQMVSKIGTGPQSGFVMVKQSPGPDEGFDCFELQRCRWGDYGGASPEPLVPTVLGATKGFVWLTNEWVNGMTDPLNATWRTWNWRASP